jgi:hypothetical protein
MLYTPKLGTAEEEREGKMTKATKAEVQEASTVCSTQGTPGKLPEVVAPTGRDRESR